VTVFWTDRAFDDLWAIREFAGRTSAVYAERVAERLVGRSEQLSAFPYSGRNVPEAGRPDVREVYERPYRIRTEFARRRTGWRFSPCSTKERPAPVSDGGGVQSVLTSCTRDAGERSGG
jgi:plasmid stabilization system protein ParE